MLNSFLRQTMRENMKEFERLLSVVDKLRDPDGGCPWDLKQTHQTLTKYLLEESYELIAEIENNHAPGIEEETGDVLLQVLLHAKIGSDNKNFNLESICKILSEKLIRRHPHVFEPKDKLTPDEVEHNWKKIKQKEKTDNRIMTGRELNAPALSSANKIGEVTAENNFDWDDYGQVIYKVEEEWQEVKEELGVLGKSLNKERIEEEIGDLLFSVAQLSRHLEIDPENALRKANKKFIKRFQALEELIKNDGKQINDLSSDETEAYWNRVKYELST